MMLCVNGSGSSGNNYVLQNENEAIVLECGLPMSKAVETVNFDLTKIRGCLVSHIHDDHAKYIQQWQDSGISVYTSQEVALSFSDVGRKITPIDDVIQLGGFFVKPFRLVHDDVPCCGYYIQHDDFGKLLFITDTAYVPQNFAPLKINHLLVEANYSKQYIESSANFGHVLQGHMEIETTKRFVQHVNSQRLNNVILLHLSTKNADGEAFKCEVQKIVSCPVYVARKGMCVELGKEVF